VSGTDTTSHAEALQFVQRQNELCLWHSNLGHIPVKDAAPVSCYSKSQKKESQKTRAVH